MPDPRDKSQQPKPPAAPPSPGEMVRELVGESAPASRAPAPEPLVSQLMEGPIQGPVKVLFLDVDGTLTDGIIGTDKDGDFRHFWVRDGLALQWARDLGVLPVVISGRSSRAVEVRMEDLELEYYGGVADKVAVAERVLAREKARWEQCVMVGDDLPDVPMMKRVGWPIATADAQPEPRRVAKTITGARGGAGAVREVVEMVLRHNGTWEKVLERYEAL
jgi:3-deoxy-D-manno-octulosonate 8-phosphate phosphatase (KDO 8-P phosphatase)